MQKKRVLSVILALTLSIGCAIPAQASSISETQKKGEELQSQKDSAEAEKAALTKQLNDLIDEYGLKILTPSRKRLMRKRPN